MHALRVLRAHLRAVPAQNAAAFNDLRVMIHYLYRLDGAFAQAFVAVLTARILKIKIIDHVPLPHALLVQTRINFREEELFAVVFVRVMDEHFVREHADAVLTVAHAETCLQIHLILHAVLFDEPLHLFDHVVRPAKMTGTAHTHFNDHNNNLTHQIQIFQTMNRYFFIDKIISTDITIEEWLKQRDIQKQQDVDIFTLGFSTFFLNRTNRSGIIKGGVIGGIEQSGNWKLDVRFNKEALIKKIQRIAAYKEKIHIFNMDAIDFLKNEVTKLDKNTLIYLDPPYYQKGKQLYMNFFEHKDHVSLYETINQLEYLWLVSYDNRQEIKEIYKNKQNLTIEYNLRYTAGKKGSGQEIMFASDNLVFTKRDPITLKEIV